jgi:hypothetical protein
VERDDRTEEAEDDEEDDDEEDDDGEEDEEEGEDNAIATAKLPGRKPLERSAANRSSTRTPKASATARTLW